MQTNTATLTITLDKSILDFFTRIAVRDKQSVETTISNLLTTLANGFKGSTN